jgi:GntR family transcriptional regulator
MLDQNNAVPLYKQLKEAVLGQILSGHLRAGDQLSTEQELSAQYGVSRITVRNAVTELVNEGYLQKRQGKGTFVCLPKIKRKAVHLLSFTATCEASGMSAYSVVSKKQVLDNYPAARLVLDLGPDDRVLYIQRIRYADGSPLMLENNYYSFKRFAFLLNEPLEGSLYKLLSEGHNIHPMYSGETQLEVQRASREIASLMQCAPGDPLFLMRTSVLDDCKQPIHYGEQLILADRYAFNF